MGAGWSKRRCSTPTHVGSSIATTAQRVVRATLSSLSMGACSCAASSRCRRKTTSTWRMRCPNGEVAELGNSVEAGERLFQFKGGMLMGGLRAHTYQLIGLVTGLDGQCTCAVWETGPQRLVTFTDNVHAMQYKNVGRLA